MIGMINVLSDSPMESSSVREAIEEAGMTDVNLFGKKDMVEETPSASLTKPE